jgi:quercetin dioxygenase-like cupin family protein
MRALALAVLTLVVQPVAQASTPDPRQVEAALTVHAGDVHGCYARALAPDQSAAGRVTVRLTLGDSDRVAKAEILNDEMRSPPLERCLTERMLAWNLAGLGGAGTELVFPLIFQSTGPRHTVKLDDVEPVPPAKGGRHEPPLQTWLLLDEKSVGAEKAALAVVQIGPKAKLAQHRHPSSAELLYVLDGHGRLLFPGAEPEKLEPGTAVWIRAGVAHSLDDQSPQKPLRLLQAFVPPGPERVLRDRSQTGGTEVLRGTAPKPPAGSYKVVREADVAPLAIAGGKARVRLLLDQAATQDASAYLGLLEADAGATVPLHKHDTSAELLFILSGRAKTVIAGQEVPAEDSTAIYIPDGAQHSAVFTATTRAVQIYAPGGPEQRFKQPPNPPGGAPPAKK